MFGFVVVLGDGPFAVALIAAPHHRDRFALDGVFRTDHPDGAAARAPVRQAEPQHGGRLSVNLSLYPSCSQALHDELPQFIGKAAVFCLQADFMGATISC